MCYIKNLNKVKTVLVSLTFLIGICWKNSLSLYAMLLLPFLAIVSLINIFVYIKDKEEGKPYILSSVFWLVVIGLALILR